MSDQILPEAFTEPPPGKPHRAKRHHAKGCLAVLVAFAVVAGGAYFAITKGVEAISDRFAAAADFDGPGRGKVIFEVESGDSVAAMGRNLKELEVIASVEAFTDAASGESKSTGIQVGFYRLKKEMVAADALAVLIDPANLVKNTITIPEGLRVVDILGILEDKTDFTRAQYTRVLAKPGSIGLPEYADGNAEGYLFPSTYDLGPNATPKTILSAMVERWQQAADEVDLEGAAEALGYTPRELMIIASLVEAEGRGDDMGKIAQVIYNRLEGDETNGLLQIDATVNYAMDRQLGVGLTLDDLEVDSPYNTYQNTGLPPTPIEAPGDDALAAAANPTDGGWFYYVTVDLRTGETKFAETYDEFLRYKSEFKKYCETSDAC